MALAAGSRLGPYEIVSPLGSGGMGEVYRARDPRLGRDVAIKVLPTSFSSDPDRLRRFEQEARAAGRLNHPNVTIVLDVGSQDGTPFVVEELLEGRTLRQTLDDAPLPVGAALDIAVQIAAGLAAAHEKNIVHRDLKPENVFVTEDGRAKILDFGLAKLVESPGGSTSTESPTASPETEPGTVFGTLLYMSPEQLRGRPADARSDIFAFGTILYEMLFGRRAFEGESAADTIGAVLSGEPLKLVRSPPGVSPALVAIVRRCLEKNPADRFQSARDLGHDLKASATTSSPSRGPGRVSAGIAALAFVALAAAAVVFWRSHEGGPRPEPGPTDRRSIAVLPFANLSPDPANAFFADGMTEDILTQLAKIRDLRVISRTSVMRYKGTTKPLKTIAAELGVGTILEGSIRREGTRVRVSGQLVDARNDEHLWAETYDRDLKDVFALQAELAQQIAGALRTSLTAREKRRLGHAPTRSADAYDSYMKGRELYYHYRKDDNEAAIALFTRASELDPAFALAYAGLGDAYSQRALRFGFPQSWLDTSLEVGRKALSIDPDLAEGHKAIGLAYYLKSQYARAIDANRAAIDVNPSYSIAWLNTCLTLRNVGRFDEALPAGLRAAKLDPTNSVAPTGIASGYEMLGDPVEAERWLHRALELQKDLGQGHSYLIAFYLRQRRDADALRQGRASSEALPKDPWVQHAAALAELVAGESARASALFEKARPSFTGLRFGAKTGGAGVETHLALLRIRENDRVEAEKLLVASLVADAQAVRDGNEDWSVSFDEACVHALRGNKDEAFRALDRAVAAGWRDWPIGPREPALDSLRADPRLAALQERVAKMLAAMRRRFQSR